MAEKGTSRTSVGVRPAHRERIPPSHGRREDEDWADDAVPAAVPDPVPDAADVPDGDANDVTDGDCLKAAGFDETGGE